MITIILFTFLLFQLNANEDLSICVLEKYKKQILQHMNSPEILVEVELISNKTDMQILRYSKYDYVIKNYKPVQIDNPIFKICQNILIENTQLDYLISSYFCQFVFQNKEINEIQDFAWIIKSTLKKIFLNSVENISQKYIKGNNDTIIYKENIELSLDQFIQKEISISIEKDMSDFLKKIQESFEIYQKEHIVINLLKQEGIDIDVYTEIFNFSKNQDNINPKFLLYYLGYLQKQKNQKEQFESLFHEMIRVECESKFYPLKINICPKFLNILQKEINQIEISDLLFNMNILLQIEQIQKCLFNQIEQYYGNEIETFVDDQISFLIEPIKQQVNFQKELKSNIQEYSLEEQILIYLLPIQNITQDDYKIVKKLQVQFEDIGFLTDIQSRLWIHFYKYSVNPFLLQNIRNQIMTDYDYIFQRIMQFKSQALQPIEFTLDKKNLYFIIQNEFFEILENKFCYLNYRILDQENFQKKMMMNFDSLIKQNLLIADHLIQYFKQQYPQVKIKKFFLIKYVLNIILLIEKQEPLSQLQLQNQHIHLKQYFDSLIKNYGEFLVQNYHHFKHKINFEYFHLDQYNYEIKVYQMYMENKENYSKDLNQNSKIIFIKYEDPINFVNSLLDYYYLLPIKFQTDLSSCFDSKEQFQINNNIKEIECPINFHYISNGKCRKGNVYLKKETTCSMNFVEYEGFCFPKCPQNWKDMGSFCIKNNQL